MTPNEQIRLECLRLACNDESNLSRNDTNHILERAQAFYDFMTGNRVILTEADRAYVRGEKPGVSIPSQ